jgi:hypothetical protein
VPNRVVSGLLRRPGKFIMQAAVTDEFLGKTARVEMPLEVFEP